jgi:hypothetical protein
MRVRVAVTAGAIAGLVGIAPLEAAKPQPACGADVYVNTTIDGTVADPGPYTFVSDGNVSYPTGGKGAIRTEGRLQYNGCWFDFTLSMGSNRSAVALLSDGTHVSKHFNFDRVASVPITPGPENTTFGDSGFCAEGVVVGADGQIRRNPDGSYQDNYGGCAADELGWYVRRAASIGLYEGPSRDFRLRYRPSPIGPHANDDYCVVNPAECEILSYVRVYHPDPNTWTILPEAPATAALMNFNESDTLQSYETVPFRVVATKP